MCIAQNLSFFHIYLGNSVLTLNNICVGKHKVIKYIGQTLGLVIGKNLNWNSYTKLLNFLLSFGSLSILFQHVHNPVTVQLYLLKLYNNTII